MEVLVGDQRMLILLWIQRLQSRLEVSVISLRGGFTRAMPCRQSCTSGASVNATCNVRCAVGGWVMQCPHSLGGLSLRFTSTDASPMPNVGLTLFHNSYDSASKLCAHECCEHSKATPRLLEILPAKPVFPGPPVLHLLRPQATSHGCTTTAINLTMGGRL